MTRVWFVSSGEYSDYSVDKVFASRALAEQYAKAGGDNGERFVEPEDDDGYEVISELPHPVAFLKIYASFGPEGFITGPHETSTSLFTGLDEAVKPISVRRWVFVGSRYGGTDSVMLTVEGTDIKGVQKVFSERSAQTIAEFHLITHSPNSIYN